MKKPVPTLTLFTVLLLGGGALSLFSRSAHSQSPALANGAPGRYQLIVQGANSQYIMDTQTGRMWYRFGTGAKSVWQEESPDYRKTMTVTAP